MERWADAVWEYGVDAVRIAEVNTVTVDRIQARRTDEIDDEDGLEQSLKDFDRSLYRLLSISKIESLLMKPS